MNIFTHILRAFALTCMCSILVMAITSCYSSGGHQLYFDVGCCSYFRCIWIATILCGLYDHLWLYHDTLQLRQMRRCRILSFDARLLLLMLLMLLLLILMMLLVLLVLLMLLIVLVWIGHMSSDRHRRRRTLPGLRLFCDGGQAWLIFDIHLLFVMMRRWWLIAGTWYRWVHWMAIVVQCFCALLPICWRRRCWYTVWMHQWHQFSSRTN